MLICEKCKYKAIQCSIMKPVASPVIKWCRLKQSQLRGIADRHDIETLQ